MKKILLGTVALLALSMNAPASAADLAARPYAKAPAPMIAAIYDWSGFYIGLNGGGGWGHKCWDRNTGIGGVFAQTEGCNDPSGAVAGGQIGYRWQAGSWVFGVEAQGDWANLTGSNTSLFVNPIILNQQSLGAQALGGTLVDRTQVNSIGLFTGQVGYAWSNVLWYLKGGAAVVSEKYNGYNPATALTVDGVSETRWGGVVGTGVEVGFAPNWSVAFEYDHLFMGSRTLDLYSTITPGLFSREDNIRQSVDLATVRVNYRWGGPVVAKY